MAAAGFWARVDPSGGPDACWEWRGSRVRGGYGLTVRPDGHRQHAHRRSWELAYGPIPKGMDVLHRCDNTACVNPTHLWLGTDADNAADCVAKGREASGERSGSAKLTEVQVRELRQLWANGWVSRDLVARFGVSRSAVYAAATGRNWACVDAARWEPAA
jgi:hypothetical protein